MRGHSSTGLLLCSHGFCFPFQDHAQHHFLMHCTLLPSCKWNLPIPLTPASSAGISLLVSPITLGLSKLDSVPTPLHLQSRAWNKDLEARPSDLHGFARLKQRHQGMEAAKGELFKVLWHCPCDFFTLYASSTTVRAWRPPKETCSRRKTCVTHTQEHFRYGKACHCLLEVTGHLVANRVVTLLSLCAAMRLCAQKASLTLPCGTHVSVWSSLAY
eukprot:1156437-Pelagomonas_calceolata.AAC.20